MLKVALRRVTMSVDEYFFSVKAKMDKLLFLFRGYTECNGDIVLFADKDEICDICEYVDYYGEGFYVVNMGKRENGNLMIIYDKLRRREELSKYEIMEINKNL